ncbi:MAG: thioesterase family protein [Dehalococcoidia bacterium]
MEYGELVLGQGIDIETTITIEMTINRTGKEGDEVLSTPQLLNLMEQACIQLTDPLLNDGYTTVGYAVDGLRHIGPAKTGQKVSIRSELINIDNNKLSYNIEAFESNNKFGFATHKRAIISK